MLTDILGGINANVTLGDRNRSWDYSGIKTVISPEKYNIVEEGDGYDYNYDVVTILCSLEDIYENESSLGNFYGGHNYGLAHGYVIQFGMCENCGCLYNNSATTESEIFKNIRDTEYGPSDTLDLFVYGLDSSGQPTNEVYYVKGTSMSDAENKCPSGYYNQSTLESGWDKAFTYTSQTVGSLTCIKPTGCRYTATIDTNIFTKKTVSIGSDTCSYANGCVNDNGYYKSGEIPSLYFTTMLVTTLPQVCYYVTGCKESYYSSDKFVDVSNPDAFVEDKSTTIKMTDRTELTCQHHTCNQANEWGTLCSPSSSGTCISANADYIKSCEYDEFAGEPVCSYYLNRCYKAMNCSAISTSTLKCGGVSCNSSQHFVFAKGALPGAFVGQPTSERDCYEYLTKASANATTCYNSSELTCTLNSDQIGPSEGLSYTCTDSYATDIYGKKLYYSTCSVDIAIVNPEPDNPEIGGGGNSNGNGSFDFIIDSNTGAVEMIKNNYHKMCGKEC